VFASTCRGIASFSPKPGRDSAIDGAIVGLDKKRLYLERDSGGQVAIARNNVDYPGSPPFTMV